MAETGRLRQAPSPRRPISAVTLLRVAIILRVLVLWECDVHSGWLYRDVVPSLLAIGRALIDLLSQPITISTWGSQRRNRRGARDRRRARPRGRHSARRQPLPVKGLRNYLYYLGPTPKIIFFPVMIMWFGVGPSPRSRSAHCHVFFPIALSVAAGMRQIDKVLIRVGRELSRSTGADVTKIYLPAMRHPIINGVRLGLGVALIGTLLAETKLSNKGIGFLIIQAYSIFDMPRMYAMLIVLFVLAIGANALIGRFGGLDSIKRT